MSLAIEITDALALIIQFIGAIVMYNNSPINRTTGTTHGGVYNPAPVNKKNRNLRNGFLLLSIGIILSLISLLIKDFNSPL
jgi:hypothetical protein